MSYEDFEQYQKEEEEKRRQERRDFDADKIEELEKEMADLKAKVKIVRESLEEISLINLDIQKLQKEKEEIKVLSNGLGNKIIKLETKQKEKGPSTNFTETDWEEQCDLMIKIADLHILWDRLLDELYEIDQAIDVKERERFGHIDKVDAIIGENSDSH